MAMVIKVRHRLVGNHWRVRFFAGPDADHLAVLGVLVFGLTEWFEFLRVMDNGAPHSGVQLIAEGGAVQLPHPLDRSSIHPLARVARWLVLYVPAGLPEVAMLSTYRNSKIFIFEGTWTELAEKTHLLVTEGELDGALPRVEIMGCDDADLADTYNIAHVDSMSTRADMVQGSAV
jgi:hypothetical protein